MSRYVVFKEHAKFMVGVAKKKNDNKVTAAANATQATKDDTDIGTLITFVNALSAKLDSDVGITDTDYASTLGTVTRTT